MIFSFNNLQKTVLPGVFFLTAVACSGPKNIDNFDSEAWKSDPHGCNGVREEIWQKFSEDTSPIMGYKENDLKSLLGKADNSHLMERGQKMYYYHISGSPACKQATASELKQVQIRVNALGRVSEVLYLEK